MIKFNILTESFVYNETIANQRLINGDEFNGLLGVSGSVLTFSGSTVNLFIDLGVQKSVDRLKYSFTPTSISGLTVQYGRETNSMVSGVLTPVAGAIEVVPSISGYTYPRYWRVTHTTSPSVPLTVDGLEIFNNDTEIDFGSDGLLNSITVVSKGLAGQSDVEEIQVKNNGIIPTDIQVGLDTSNDIDFDLLNRISFSTTEDGPFYTVNSGLSIPNEVPWQFGAFQNLIVTDDNDLRILDPNVPAIGTSWNPSIVGFLGDFQRPAVDVVLPDNSVNLVRISLIGGLHKLSFTDPVLTTFSITGSGIPYTITNTITELQNQHFAYDGLDNIYWLRGHSTAGGASTIYKYKISTDTYSLVTTLTTTKNTFAGKGLVYDNGNLYIMGGTSTLSSSTTTGVLNIKYNIALNTETAVASLPISPASGASFRKFENYIYYSSLTSLWRYNIGANIWTLMPTKPAGGDIQSVSINTKTREVWVVDGDDGGICSGTNNHAPTIRPFNVDTKVWGTSFVPACGFFAGTVSTIEEMVIFRNGSVLYFKNNSTTIFKTEIRDIVPTDADGVWTSPIFKLDQVENFNRLLINRDKVNSPVVLKTDESIAAENFLIRGSDLPPASDNAIELFNEPLDEDAFVVGNFSEFDVTLVSGSLIFGHDFIDSIETPINASFVYFSFPFNSLDKMQYQFDWFPATNSTTGSQKSKFYIVPFIDSIETGLTASRSPTNFSRTVDDYIYIQFGSNTDSSGDITQLSVYNGSTTVSFNVSVELNSFNTVNWIINWETGAYTLVVNGAVIGTGIIPTVRLSLLGPQHSYEFFSSGADVDFQEKYKNLTINRVGNVPIDEDELVIPLHREDPLYGISGSLSWFPVTVNSPLIPKTKYIQFRLNLRTTEGESDSGFGSIEFPVVSVLKNVQPGEIKSVYVKYDFPSSNNLVTKVINLKAWAFTDKL